MRPLFARSSAPFPRLRRFPGKRRSGLLRLVSGVIVGMACRGVLAQPSEPRVDVETLRSDHRAATENARSRVAAGDPAGAWAAYAAFLARSGPELTDPERDFVEDELARLARETGTINLSEVPGGAEVIVDGTLLGIAPLPQPVRVNPGPHQVRVMRAGYHPVDATVEVPAGGSAGFPSPSLQPVPTTGLLTVTVTLPPGTAPQLGESFSTYINGVPVGPSPWQGRLPPGRHRVGASSPRFWGNEQLVDVAPGRSYSVIVALAPAPGILEIRARSGRILLDGVVVGDAVFTGRVHPGYHDVTVERSGGPPFQQRVVVQPGGHATIDVPDVASGRESAGSESYAGGSDDRDLGLYFDFALLGMFGTRSTHEWGENCPTIPSLSLAPACNTSPPIGGGLGVRLGFSFGTLGVEGFAFGSGDWSRAGMDGLEIPNVPAVLQDMHVGRVGAGLGGGLRVASAPGLVRVRLGLGGGVALRHVFTTVSSLDGSSTGYQAPLILGDLSLLLFKFLSVGAFAWVEFPRDVTVLSDLTSVTRAATMTGQTSLVAEIDAALGRVTVFEGPQFFLGPTVGLHFGK